MLGRVPALLRRMAPPSPRPLKREYDYVIVGAGSAGCVLANELSADGTKDVLVVEAGAWDTNPLIHIPAGVYSVFKDPSLNWNMETEPEPECVGRRIELPRGKVVGGSSSINAMVYMRGYPNATQPTVSRPFCAVFPPFFCAVRLPGAQTQRTGEKWRKMGEIWGRNGRETAVA